MKTRFTLLFLFIASNFCTGQEILSELGERVNRVPYIFEGRVIRSDCYLSLNGDMIYTSSTVEITKIAKGSMVCGTVEIITVGGTVMGKTITISHNLVLSKGMMGVFLCDDNIWETSTTDFYPETNTTPMWVPDGLQGFFRYHNDGINYAVADWQFSLDSLARLYDLMGLFTTLNLVDCNAAPLPPRQAGHSYPPLSMPTYANSPIPTPILPPPPPFQSGDTNIHFDFLNRHIMVAGSTKYFEFDIAISDNMNGYFNSATFQVDYSYLIFGYNIVAGTNVELTTTGTFAGTSAYQINPYDDPNDSDRLIIQIVPDTNSSAPFVDLPDYNPSQLSPSIHVRIEIVDCSIQGAISMLYVTPYVYPTWSISQYYSTATPLHYGLPYWSTILEFPTCGIHIDNVTTSSFPITGGTRDTVTVTGLNFDTARGGGNVWMRTAHDNRSYIHLDSVDYLTWNDSVITFVLPGQGEYLDQTGALGTPGSGRFMVKNDAGDSAQVDSITVWYSILSAFDSSHFKKYMYNLGNVYSFQNGYEFMIDTALGASLHPDRWKTVDVAIKQWVCLSGVNFILGDTLTPRDYVAMGDTVCRIQFGRTTSESTVAQAVMFKIRFPVCDLAFTEEIDIIIDSTRKDSLFWDINCNHDVPVGKYDIYASILHELGHGHSINHVNDRRNIMYWLDRGRYGVASSDRNILIKLDQSASDAANYVTAKAADPFFTTPGCISSLLGVRTISDCDSLPRKTGCTFIGVEEVSGAWQEITVVPNPASTTLEFGIKSNSSVTCYVEVRDIFGRRLSMTEGQNLSVGWNYIPIDVSNLSNGVYCIGVHTKKGSAFTKFIKE